MSRRTHETEQRLREMFAVQAANVRVDERTFDPQESAPHVVGVVDLETERKRRSGRLTTVAIGLTAAAVLAGALAVTRPDDGRETVAANVGDDTVDVTADALREYALREIPAGFREVERTPGKLEAACTQWTSGTDGVVCIAMTGDITVRYAYGDGMAIDAEILVTVSGPTPGPSVETFRRIGEDVVVNGHAARYHEVSGSNDIMRDVSWKVEASRFIEVQFTGPPDQAMTSAEFLAIAEDVVARDSTSAMIGFALEGPELDATFSERDLFAGAATGPLTCIGLVGSACTVLFVQGEILARFTHDDTVIDGANVVTGVVAPEVMTVRFLGSNGASVDTETQALPGYAPRFLVEALPTTMNATQYVLLDGNDKELERGGLPEVRPSTSTGAGPAESERIIAHGESTVATWNLYETPPSVLRVRFGEKHDEPGLTLIVQPPGGEPSYAFWAASDQPIDDQHLFGEVSGAGVLTGVVDPKVARMTFEGEDLPLYDLATMFEEKRAYVLDGGGATFPGGRLVGYDAAGGELFSTQLIQEDHQDGVLYIRSEPYLRAG